MIIVIMAVSQEALGPMNVEENPEKREDYPLFFLLLSALEMIQFDKVNPLCPKFSV